jgi:hypothetical protein
MKGRIKGDKDFLAKNFVNKISMNEKCKDLKFNDNKL